MDRLSKTAAAVHDIAQYLTNGALSMQIQILSKIINNA